MTEIPFRGAYALTGTTDDHAAGGVHHATPSMVRPVAEAVHERRTTAAAAAGRGRRQLVTALGAVGTAIAAGLGANAAGLVTNAAGLVTNAGGQLGGAAGGGGGGGLVAAAVGHGGNRNQVTVRVTRVQKVLDDRVTVTLVPKNCVPDAGQVRALRPCAADGHRPYAGHDPQRTDDDAADEEPTDAAADVASRVHGLVRDAALAGRAAVARPSGAGPF